MDAKAAWVKQTPCIAVSASSATLFSRQRSGDRIMAINACAGEAMDDDCDLDADAHGKCAELCFASDVAMVILDGPRLRAGRAGELATQRERALAEIKRAVVAKVDGLLNKAIVRHLEQASIA
eukprot:7018405-Pyramimonas_sp.AAC.1